jgi:putative lipoprotein
VFRSRPTLRHLGLLGVAVALVTGLLAFPAAAATSSVTGSLTYREKVALTPAAVAIVTIVDSTAAADAGAIVGQQRIDAPGNIPIDFSVLVDQSAIVSTHSYALYATITDGRSRWQNAVGEPAGPGRG